MKKYLIFFLFNISLLYSQNKDVIFRVEAGTRDALGYSYNVDILILKENQKYDLIKQEYLSKKFARKNIPSKFSKAQGIWSINNDTLKLIDNDSKRKILFILIKEKYLMKLFNNEDISNFHWKKIHN